LNIIGIFPFLNQLALSKLILYDLSLLFNLLLLLLLHFAEVLLNSFLICLLKVYRVLRVDQNSIFGIQFLVGVVIIYS
jgi:hypothetical protein